MIITDLTWAQVNDTIEILQEQGIEFNEPMCVDRATRLYDIEIDCDYLSDNDELKSLWEYPSKDFDKCVIYSHAVMNLTIVKDLLSTLDINYKEVNDPREECAGETILVF
tara:strand:+ start:259 stop:588 length:330 start_codon:yes stop_codon:yes gene_type:complete